MRILHRIALPLLAACLSTALHAQDKFPEHPLTLVVPYPAGGAADVIARALATELGKRLGQAVIIDNRAGANGNIGSAWVARQQAADGYTLLLGSTSTLAINPHLYKSMGYDPIKDLQPLSLTHKMANVLVVGASTPYKTVTDVVNAAKSQPGSLAFGSAGNGNTMHLAGVLFQEKSDTRLVHVPYKGGPPALNDVLAGQIPMMFNNLPAVVSVHHAGKVRALAIADTQRSPLLPQTPTMAEAGLPGVVSVVWNGLLVRRGTPAPVVERLNTSLRAILASPEFRKPIEAQGYEVLSSTSDEFEALIKQDWAAMAVTIPQADIRLD